MMTNYLAKRNDDTELPPWFTRPYSRDPFQGSLFPTPIYDTLARLRISPDELARWHQERWISFDTGTVKELEQVHEDELRFVRDIVRSGLSDAVLHELFEQLPTPANVDPDLIAYSFTHGWVMPSLTCEPDLGEYMEENIDAWLDQLAEEGQVERLVELKTSIEDRLIKAAMYSEQESEA